MPALPPWQPIKRQFADVVPHRVRVEILSSPKVPDEPHAAAREAARHLYIRRSHELRRYKFTPGCPGMMASLSHTLQNVGQGSWNACVGIHRARLDWKRPSA
eukprot:2883171-Amphidinium_carterae.1